MIKTTGAEFKRFYSDPEFWKDGIFHEEEIVMVNGEEADSYGDLGKVDDADAIEISDGIVYSDSYELELGTFEGYFRKWRKKQNFAFLTIEAPKDKIDVIKTAIKAAGGKVR